MGSDETCSWHDAKREANFATRGIDFADLAVFFSDPACLVREDVRRDYGERRFNMIASVEGVVLNITFTPRDGLNHIISARLASRRERAVYATGIAKGQN